MRLEVRLVTNLARLHRALHEAGYGSRMRIDEPLARYCSFGIGGPADILVVALQLAELEELVRLAWASAVPVRVLGGGTNVLVADRGIRGLVVINACRGYRVDQDGLLLAQSGALLCEVANDTVAQGWAGLEWAVGVPGTMGGAVVGNAGAYGGAMADGVRWVDLLLPDGTVEHVGADALAYAYRDSALKRDPCARHRRVVLRVGLQLSLGDVADLKRIAESNMMQRQVRTPSGCCAGSVFKRTPEYPPGFLIEQAGLKGCRIGGAEVSSKHANFIMNVGGATAADVRALVDLVQAKVKETFGQLLEPEIEYLGEWG